jgi:NAD(P) transhydrogenase subunit beta
MTLPLYIQAAYFAASVLFILGLKRMSSPATAKAGIRWAGAGMVVATAVTFFVPGLQNLALIVVALALGALPAW